MRVFSLIPWKLVALGALAAIGMLTSCAKDDPSTNINLVTVAFPNGTKITAETARTPFEQTRGMMFRTSLPADRGMLFVHSQPDKYQYFMYQTKIPLDMIWMGADHKIVEIVADAQPCTTKASECPKLGGHEIAALVLEVNAGVAAKNSLHTGDYLDF